MNSTAPKSGVVALLDIPSISDVIVAIGVPPLSAVAESGVYNVATIDGFISNEFAPNVVPVFQAA